jgi:hypothetical protein
MKRLAILLVAIMLGSVGCGTAPIADMHTMDIMPASGDNYYIGSNASPIMRGILLIFISIIVFLMGTSVM